MRVPTASLYFSPLSLGLRSVHAQARSVFIKVCQSQGAHGSFCVKHQDFGRAVSSRALGHAGLRASELISGVRDVSFFGGR